MSDDAAPTGWTEAPIAWRVHWIQVPDRLLEKTYRPAPQHQDFPTKAEAEAEKLRLRALLGDKAVVHIQPRYLSSAKRQRKLAALQDSLTAGGWPIQMRPPRPGATSRRKRRT